MNSSQKLIERNLRFIQYLLGAFVFFIIGFGTYYFLYRQLKPELEKETTADIVPLEIEEEPFTAPSEWRINKEPNAEEIKYGKELIANTAYYLGFNGTIKQITNGLNCQNCHLEAGTKPWGNNYLAVASNYPQVRKRSGKMTSISDRINGCLQRSLNGKALDSSDKEMKAMTAYIKWVGQDAFKGTTPHGAKIYPIKNITRAADPAKGFDIYIEKCQSCHQADGSGVLAENKRSFTYPPLWGPLSYNDGAGLFRMSKLAGYVKMNMPYGASYKNQQLTDEEAWDVAAYINSQPRPVKDKSKDWPKLADKPVDHPFGPYVDPYSELQHKYGPFDPIKEWYKKNKK